MHIARALQDYMAQFSPSNSSAAVEHTDALLLDLQLQLAYGSDIETAALRRGAEAAVADTLRHLMAPDAGLHAIDITYHDEDSADSSAAVLQQSSSAGDVATGARGNRAKGVWHHAALRWIPWHWLPLWGGDAARVAVAPASAAAVKAQSARANATGSADDAPPGAARSAGRRQQRRWWQWLWPFGRKRSSNAAGHAGERPGQVSSQSAHSQASQQANRTSWLWGWWGWWPRRSASTTSASADSPASDPTGQKPGTRRKSGGWWWPWSVSSLGAALDSGSDDAEPMQRPPPPQPPPPAMQAEPPLPATAPVRQVRGAAAPAGSAAAAAPAPRAGTGPQAAARRLQAAPGAAAAAPSPVAAPPPSAHNVTEPSAPPQQADEAQLRASSEGALRSSIVLLAEDVDETDEAAAAAVLRSRRVRRTLRGRLNRAVGGKATPVLKVTLGEVLRATVLRVPPSAVRPQAQRGVENSTAGGADWARIVADAAAQGHVQRPPQVWSLAQSESGELTADESDLKPIERDSEAADSRTQGIVLLVVLSGVFVSMIAVCVCYACMRRQLELQVRAAPRSQHASGGGSRANSKKGANGQPVGESAAAGAPFGSFRVWRYSSSAKRKSMGSMHGGPAGHSMDWLGSSRSPSGPHTMSMAPRDTPSGMPMASADSNDIALSVMRMFAADNQQSAAGCAAPPPAIPALIQHGMRCL